MKRLLVNTLLLAATTTWFAAAQTYTLKTAAGNVPDRTGSRAAQVLLYSPEAVALDSSGNLYIADTGGRRIWKIDATTGIASSILGNGIYGNGGDGAAANKATISLASGLAVDAAGNIYVSDRDNARVRKIDAKTGNVVAFACYGSGRFSGDGKKAIDAGCRNPRGIAIDANGNVYFADTGNNRIRKVDTNGIITTFAGVVGSGFSGDGGPARLARLNAPEDVAVDLSTGIVYIADTGNHKIRAVTSDGNINTVVNAAVDPNATYSVSNASCAVTKSTAQQLAAGQAAATGSLVITNANGISSSTPQGSPVPGNTIDTTLSGLGTLLNGPAGIAFANGGLYISDRCNNRVLLYNATTKLVTLLGTPATSGPGTGSSNASPVTLPGRIAVDGAGRVYVPEMGTTHFVKLLDPNTQTAAVIAGAQHITSDGTAVSAAIFNNPYGVAVDSKGVIYFSDPPANRVYKVTPDGFVFVVAGSGAGGAGNSNSNVGDGGAAVVARLSAPRGLALDSSNNLFIADSGTHRIRKVDQGGNISTVAGGGTTTIASAGSSGFSGDGGPATRAQLNTPSGVSVDAVGNIYIADTNNHVIRKVTTDGTINTIIGRQGISGIGGDGGPATEATLNSPQGIFVDPAGANIFIADTASCEVRQVVVNTGTIFDIAGTPGDCDRDGGPNVGNRLRMRQPIGIALDGNGNLLIADQNNSRIRRLDLKSLQLTEVAGNGPSGPGTATQTSVPTGSFNIGVNYGGDGASSTASTAQLSAPAQVAVDSAGNVYFAEQGNGVIRVLVPNK